MNVVVFTILIAAVSTACIAPFALALAAWSWRAGARAAIVDAIAALPLVLPPTAVGFLLLELFARRGPLGWLHVLFTPAAVVIACGVMSFPLMFTAFRVALETTERRYFDLARTLGATPLRAFVRVTLPLAWRGLLSGVLLAYCRAIGEFGATILVAGNIPGRTQTIALAIYDRVQEGRDADAALLVLYVVLIAASLTAFSTIPQSLAANDWIVFQPNYRGSDNAGNDFTRAINDDSGAGPGRDVMAGVEALKKKGFVDETRIAVGGWSYGGYMTTWMIGHYPIFKAAVSGAAVNNLLDQYVLGDGGPGRALTWGSPFKGDNAKKYIEQSPIAYASKITTPTLILSDTGDVRVPVVQSYQLYRALRDNGVPVRFIAYPVGGHSPEDPLRQTDIERRYVEWFSLYLK